MAPTKHFAKSSDNLYKFFISEAAANAYNHHQQEQRNEQTVCEAKEQTTQTVILYTPKPIERQPPTPKPTYTEKWLNSTISRALDHLKTNSIAVPLPTHIETDSAEPSPTQAFGPKVLNIEDIPGTAMRRGLGIHLNTPLVDGSSYRENTDQCNKINSSQSNVLQDQFGYKQLIPTSRKSSKSSMTDSSLNGSHYGSRNTSKSHSASNDEGDMRRISKQDREVKLLKKNRIPLCSSK